MHSMHHNASDECILSSWESWKAHQCALMLISIKKLYSQSWNNMIFFFIKLLIQMLAQKCRTRGWFQKVHVLWRRLFRVEQTHSVFFEPLFLLTKLKSRHAERTQFEGYSVAKGTLSLLKASGYPMFKMHLLKVAKVNILCLSCTQNLLQSGQPKCTQLGSCSGTIALKKLTNAPFFFCVKHSVCNMMHCTLFGCNISIPNIKEKRFSLCIWYPKTSQELRMLSRSLPDYESLTPNIMIKVTQFVSNSQLCH